MTDPRPDPVTTPEDAVVNGCAHAEMTHPESGVKVRLFACASCIASALDSARKGAGEAEGRLRLLLGKAESDLCGAETALRASEARLREKDEEIARLTRGLESKIGPDWREALPYESELELADEVARLRGELMEDRSVCLCGCADHENYGEDGESCENEFHACIRVALGVQQAFEAEKATARRDALEEAAKALESEAFEIQVCAESYHSHEPGNPRESLMRESSHYLQAAQSVLKLVGTPPQSQEPPAE